MPRAAVLPAGVGAAGFRLLNDWQRCFPLEAKPFVALASQLGLSEEAVIAAYRAWLASGIVSRIGAVFAPRRIGASALVAMRVPPGRLAEVAERVSAEPGVNHNYEREHRFNLWFVVATPTDGELSRTVEDIGRDTGCPTMVLPLLDEYHIDLGFGLADDARAPRVRTAALPAAPVADPLSALERRVFAVLQDGLPLVSAPYAELGRRIGASQAQVIESIGAAQASGLIRRFGVVIRHHELGIGANAMCVWDVPDDSVGEFGRRLAREPIVTLCYRRPRVLPDWRYNLFCMIHGSQRDTVIAARDEIGARLGLDAWPHRVLFSGRRFKQSGARYFSADEGSGHAPAADGTACHA